MEKFLELDSRFPELVPKLAYEFVHAGRHRANAILEAVAKEDWAAVRFNAHSLRTSAAYLGATYVEQLCARFDEDPTSAAERVDEFNTAYQESANIVERLGLERGMTEGCPTPKPL